MAQILHRLEVCTLDLVGRRFTHLWGGTPVILAGQEVDRTLLDIYVCHSVTCVEAAEVEVEVTVEDSVLYREGQHSFTT